MRGTALPQDGGCWFCHIKDKYLVFDSEFDTSVHLECIREHMKDNPEAQMMEYLLNTERELEEKTGL